MTEQSLRGDLGVDLVVEISTKPPSGRRSKRLQNIDPPRSQCPRCTLIRRSAQDRSKVSAWGCRPGMHEWRSLRIACSDGDDEEAAGRCWSLMVSGGGHQLRAARRPASVRQGLHWAQTASIAPSPWAQSGVRDSTSRLLFLKEVVAPAGPVAMASAIKMATLPRRL